MSIRAKSKISIALGVLLTSLVAVPGHASLLCEKGLIRAISSNTGTGHFKISTGLSTTAEHGKQAILGLFGTAINAPENYNAFLEKYTLAKAAYATGSFIYLTVDAGSSCSASAGEFTFVVCNTATDCSP
jgi:hypothetical protein